MEIPDLFGAMANTWELSARASLSIGAVEGDPHYQLFRVQGAHRLEDGRSVVANAGSHEIRFYGTDGRYLFASGRQGDGPGEFRSLARLDVLGDSIFAYCRGTRRISVFTSDGRLARSFGVPAVGESPAPRLVGLFADRSLLVAAAPAFWIGPETGVQRPTETYIRVDPTGVVLDTLGEFVGGEQYVEVEESGVVAMALPFARQSVVAVGRESFYFGASDTYEVSGYSIDGRLERLIRAAMPNLPVTPEDLTNFIRERQRYVSSEEARRSMEAMFRRLPLPTGMPAYSAVRLDTDGNLWIETYGRPGAPAAQWVGVGADGRFLASVAVPVSLTIYQIGTDFVLGLRTDDVGVEYVDVYQLLKTGDGGLVLRGANGG